MAQTVALQRGTTSVTANNTSSVTLFTQSGGTATRVIVNSLNITFSPQPNTGTQYVLLVVTPSGGQSAVIGLLRTSSANVAMQFTPAGSPDNQFLAQPYYNGNFYSPNPAITGNSSSGVGASNASSVGITWVSNSTGLPLNIISSNFWIGPSDVVSMKAFAQQVAGKSTTNCTMSISYSFTTITES
jgi:hypothetical protein